jgi:hypothetical protein
MGCENATGDAQAEHEGVLRRGDVEEAKILDAEAVFLGWRLVVVGVLKELVPNG